MLSLRYFKITFLILLLLFLFHLINNIIVIKLNNTPIVYDAGEYYNNAKSYFFNSHISTFRPPLITFLSLPIFKLFGPSQKAVSFGIGAYSLFLALLATYLLGEELYSKDVGLLSALILSSLPIIFGHSRTCMSDLLLAGWVTCSILLMMQPEAFISLKYIIPIGIVIGLGLLTRISYPLYVLGPFIYILIKKENRNSRIYFNLFLIFLIAFSICQFWYLPNAFKTVDEYIKIGQFRLAHITSDMPFKYILKTLLKDWLGLVCIMLFFIALLRPNKIQQPRRTLFLIWIAVPYLTLSFMEFRNPRFIIPILPALVIIDSYYILNIKRIFYRKAMIITIVFLGIAQIIFISYFALAQKIYDFLEEPFNEWNFQCFGLLQPSKQDWKFIEACNSIRTITPDVQKKVIFIKTRPLVVDGLREECNFKILLSHFELCCMNLRRDELRNENLLFSKLDEAGIVIKVEDSAFDDEACENDNKLDELFEKNIHKFNLVNFISLPDGSHLKIYKSR